MNRADEVTDKAVGGLIIHADPVLHGHRYRHAVLHGFETVRNLLRGKHQDHAEVPGLHAGRWAAAVEVDLVKPSLFPPFRALGELRRIGSAKLQRDRIHTLLIPEEPCPVPMHQRGRRDHLGVESRAL